MVETQITAEPFHGGHIPDLIALGRTYYPPGSAPLDERFLRWLYQENPDGAAVLVIAREGKCWTGLIALIPVTLVSSGQTHRAAYAVNVLTHPEHRGKRLFVKMIEHAQSVLALEGRWLLGHPSASATPGWKRQSMQFRDPLDLYVAKFRWPFSSVRTRRIQSIGDLRSIPSSFWDELARRQDVHVNYRPEFFEWRFLNPPHRKYVLSRVEKRGALLGLTATRHFRGPFDLLVDFVGHPRAVGELVGNTTRPTIVAYPKAGWAGREVAKESWKLPVRRQLPFFATTWDADDVFDMSGVSLAASDI